MLSNAGLYEMAGMLGREWQHLATLLNVPSSKVDHFRLDHPNDTASQIYKMLRFWRDSERGTKEQLKGTMHKALTEVRRLDLAERLMQEQVEGSVERLGMTSLI